MCLYISPVPWELGRQLLNPRKREVLLQETSGVFIFPEGGRAYPEGLGDDYGKFGLV